MANSIELEPGLLDRLVARAQTDVEEVGIHNEQWVWSYASEAVSVQTARLGFATFRGMGLIRGDVDPDTVSRVLEDPGISSDEDRFVISLLTDQAQHMVTEKGEHDSAWVNSRASTAVAHETGRFALGIAKEGMRDRHDIRRVAFVHSLKGVLMKAHAEIKPEVREQIEANWNYPR